MKKNILEIREEINLIDQQMAALFEQRMQLSEQVANYKKEHGLPVLDAEREKEILQDHTKWLSDKQFQGYYADFLQQIMRISRSYQNKLLSGMKVAYCGIQGAYAFIAAHRIFPTAQKISYASFREAYDMVVKNECDAVILPLENSSAGEVGQVSDLLFQGTLFINGTYVLEISHDLIVVPGTRIEEIKTIISHPQALNQCADFIEDHGWRQIADENTALAARRVADRKDPSLAAIASRDCAELYGLEILAAGINTSQLNSTRFAIISGVENISQENRQELHFALMFTVANEAGSLARALNIIGAHGFNLRSLRSRPMRDSMWQYYFYAEADGNIHSSNGRDMLEALHVCCRNIKVIGSFIELKG